MPEAPLPNCLPPDTIGATTMGQHEGLPPTLLSPRQLSMAVNLTMRGGYPETRPPYRKIALTYSDENVQVNLRNKFQGAAFYRSISANPSCLVASVGGRIFRFSVVGNSATVDDITPIIDNGVTQYPDINDPTLPQTWMAQGEDFLVIQNGQANPFFFDGGAVRRSKGLAGAELPPGKQIVYSNGRFITALTDGISYVASDLVYNTDSGTAAYNYRDSILRTTDNVNILAGRAFAVPANSGGITALFSCANPDSSLGQGPLQIGTEEGIYSALLPLDATLWTTTQMPQQVVALPGNGPTGFYAVALVNGDAWYRSNDGFRSFKIARRDFDNEWVQTSLSFEMQRILPFDQQDLLPFASFIRFNNRLLGTCSPYTSDGRGIAHRGLVALDFNNISSLTTKATPAYDGLWTGIPILQLVKGKFNGVERAFAFALDGANDICLYEIGYDDSGWFDFDGVNDVNTESQLESGALFGLESFPKTVTGPLKKLITSDLFFAQLVGAGVGTVTFNVKFRGDEYPFWVDWTTFTLCAAGCPTTAACAQPSPVQPQYACFKRLPEPPDTCNELTGRPHRQAYYFQIKLTTTGHVELRHSDTWAIQAPATRNVVCAPGVCHILQGCTDSPFTYRIETGPGTDLLEWSVDVGGSGAPTYDTTAGSLITPIV